MSRNQLYGSLLATLALALSACTGGGGGGGGDDDDDTPPPPDRPGWVAIRWKTPAADQVMSVRILDATSSLVDLALPAGAKSLVGFADPSATAGDEKILVRIATSSTAGDIYVANLDGTGLAVAATGVSRVFDWADPTHLVVQKGPDPTQSISPQRDLYLVPIDASGEVPLTTDPADEEYGGMAAGKIVFRRGPLIGESDLYTVDALGGTPQQLTSDAGAEIFFGITQSNRVVFQGGTPPNMNLYAIPITGGTKATLADGPDPEIPSAIRGDRVVFTENVSPQPDFIEGNVKAVNADGSSAVDLAATADVPENPVGITGNGTVLITQQTSFDPVIINLIAVPIGGGSPVDLGDLASGGVSAIVGDRIVVQRTEAGADSGTISAVNADGSAEVELATGAIFRGVTTSRVIFGRQEGADEKLYSVSLSGGSERQLRPGAGTDSYKGHVGNVVVLSVPGTGGAEDLMAVDSNGQNLRTLAGQDDAEQFRALTPDGRVIFSRRRGAFLDDIYVVNHDGTNELPMTDRPDVDVYMGHLP